MFFYNESDSEISQQPGVSDPHFSNVSLLLKMNNDFSDSSANNITYTVTGNPAVSAGEAYFDGSGDYVVYDSSAATNLYNTDWTIELRFKADGAISAPKGVFQTTQGGGGWYPYYSVFLSPGNIVEINRNFARTAIATYTPGQWHHIAFVRSGNNLTTYFDGSATETVVNNAPNIDFNFLIGMLTNWQGYYGYFQGFIDEVRVTKGVARYTANFTPPTDLPTS